MLENLLEESKVKGWAAGQATLAEVQLDAALLGWSKVPTRRGGPALSTLRPVDPAEAEPNSLSARYGKGIQPLHTDGAHLPHPRHRGSDMRDHKHDTDSPLEQATLRPRHAAGADARASRRFPDQ